ncbi:hypothetical protein DENSPDRAFT_788155 [Dentipellis sp. KUC8613]|nr:hypothetical protein DENSPDRAFT_788155 [Dentipellis sp. KUC8613]
MTIKTMKAHAIQHLLSGNAALGIGRAAEPESLYDNPQLYPQAFPWLFPYGLGGIGNMNGFKKLSDITRVRSLLLHHDKRFQLEPFFPLVALNHQQIKHTATGGYLTTQRKDFANIAERILKIDIDTMTSLIERMDNGQLVKPESASEKECFAMINDLDHVSKHVEGSISNKKFMRNEIWSVICARGAPTWFITFAPTDLRHPLCLY